MIRESNWHPVDLPGKTGGTRVFDSPVPIGRINVIVDWNSPQTRRKWDRAVSLLKLGTVPKQQFGANAQGKRPRLRGIDVYGTVDALTELIHRPIILDWTDSDGTIARHGAGTMPKPR